MDMMLTQLAITQHSDLQLNERGTKLRQGIFIRLMYSNGQNITASS